MHSLSKKGYHRYQSTRYIRERICSIAYVTLGREFDLLRMFLRLISSNRKIILDIYPRNHLIESICFWELDRLPSQFILFDLEDLSSHKSYDSSMCRNVQPCDLLDLPLEESFAVPLALAKSRSYSDISTYTYIVLYSFKIISGIPAPLVVSLCKFG